ncbi:MAG: hypothetical protein K8S22_17690 [Betaproteobacteria bacterium]|nr:hypothetical protein [Betaproteobacteria bacterium]
MPGPAKLQSVLRAPSRQRGFGLITGIFIVVVLVALGGFIISITGYSQSSSQRDVLGVRAYHAARAGLEWAAWQSLDPNNTIGTAVLPNCPASPTTIPAGTLAGTLSLFTVTVTCVQTNTTEGNRNIAMYAITSTACNQPGGAGCPNAAPGNTYVERQVQATLAKCKDPTAPAPTFSCS